MLKKMVDFKFQIGLIGYVHYNEQIMFKIRSDGYSVHFNLILNGENIGEATITTKSNFYSEKSSCFYIHSVGILSTLHNMGYGTILMRFVVKWLKKLHDEYGLDYAMLYMTKDRIEDKIRFYKRVGFVLAAYDENGVTPMFYTFNKKGEEIIDEINIAQQKYQNTYDETFSYILKESEKLTKKELYDLIYGKVMKLNIHLEMPLKTEDMGKYEAYRDFFYKYFHSKEYNWFDIYDDLRKKCKY